MRKLATRRRRGVIRPPPPPPQASALQVIVDDMRANSESIRTNQQVNQWRDITPTAPTGSNPPVGGTHYAFLTAWVGSHVSDRDIYFIAGGGHDDGGWNHICTINMDAMECRRLNDPEPLAYDIYEAGKHSPVNGPPGNHSGGGCIYLDGVIHQVCGFGYLADATGWQCSGHHFSIAEPDITDPTKWVYHGQDWGSAICRMSPTRIYCKKGTQDGHVDLANPTVFVPWSSNTSTVTRSSYDPVTDFVYLFNFGDVITKVRQGTPVSAPVSLPAPMQGYFEGDGGGGFVFRGGKGFLWGGEEHLVVYDPSDDSFVERTLTGLTSSPQRNVHGRWVYFSDVDAFVGIHLTGNSWDPTINVFVYLPDQDGF